MEGIGQELKLKRCPFCGGEAHHIRHSFGVGYQDYYQIVCLECSVAQQEYGHDSLESAIEDWNRRT